MKKWLWLTAHSASHKDMYDKHFLPSFNQHLAKHCELSTRVLPYYAGSFGEDAFNEMGRESVAYTCGIIKQNIGRHIVVSGCDLRFYKDIILDIEKALQNCDLVGLNDIHGPVCGELLAFVASEKIVALYEWIVANDRQYGNEQWTLNAGLRALGLNCQMMPGTYWTAGMQGTGVWQKGDHVAPPKDICLHHANFTIGAENKMALLDAVQAAVAGDTTPSA
jgi:hypothetical protein